jgi:septal ring factor EnvC (AmiA/AmiB activator)
VDSKCFSDVNAILLGLYFFSQGIQTAITILKDFASQFSSLQADNTRLQEDVLSTTSKLDQAVKIAATARQNADSLKKELNQLKRKLQEGEKEKAKAQAQRKEREDLLHKSSMALLGNVIVLSSNSFYLVLLASNFCSYFL